MNWKRVVCGTGIGFLVVYSLIAAINIADPFSAFETILGTLMILGILASIVGLIYEWRKEKNPLRAGACIGFLLGLAMFISSRMMLFLFH